MTSYTPEVAERLKLLASYRTLDDRPLFNDGAVTFGDLRSALAELDSRAREIERLRAELEAERHDLGMVGHEVSLVYDHVTGGRASKPNTYAFEIISLADDHYGEIERENTAEAVEDYTAERDSLKARVGRLEAALAHTRYVVAASFGERDCPWSALEPDECESAHRALCIIDDVTAELRDIEPAIDPKWLAVEQAALAAATGGEK